MVEMQKHAHHDRGLVLIGLFKLGKALLFFCIGVGAVHFLHKDLEDTVMQVATALRFDTESHFVELVLRKADLLTPHRLREISLATFAYSALALTEGVGLLMEKVWAEYLTLILTIAFLPWEAYELVRRTSTIRAGVVGLNLVVLAYLVWLLRQKGRLGVQQVHEA